MATTAATRRTWSKPPFIRDARLRWALGLGAALYLAVAFGTLDINWLRVMVEPALLQIARRLIDCRDAPALPCLRGEDGVAIVTGAALKKDREIGRAHV